MLKKKGKMRGKSNLFFFSFFFSDSDPLNWAVVGGPAGVTNSDRTQIKVVNRIVSHPMAGKIRGFYHNDLALVQLTTSFEFDSFIQPICVSDSEPQVGDLCVVAGWTENPSEQGMLINDVACDVFGDVILI